MKKFLLLSACGLGLAMSVVLFLRAAEERKASDDFPEGTFWLCQDGQHEFVRSIDELASWYSRHSVNPPCPKCGKQNAARASRCPHQSCRRFFLKADNADGTAVCPRCRRELSAEMFR